jgi:predicted dehydrogenase
VQTNYFKMNNNRRSFIKKSAIGSLAFTILPTLGKGVASSDRIRVAHIGVGGMGNNHINWFSELPEVEIVALCDVDEIHLNESLKNLKTKKPDLKLDGYSDFRRILERNDIDAITCATPDHWHAQIANLAFQAGKDVYGEKPLSYDVKEGQMMLENLNKYNRVFQLGTQIHAGENYHRVVDVIKSGAIGKVHTVRLWKNQNSPVQIATENPTVPDTLNWDMWLGSAPFVDYEPSRCHRSYRYFLDYSGGVFADFWCHIADIVWWSINPQGLKTIDTKGKKPKGIGDAPKWLDADFEFENLKIHWTTKPPKVYGAEERGIGAYFEGEKGTLICDYNTKAITINRVIMEDIPSIPKTTKRSPGHQQNFVDAVKSRIQPESNLAYARKMTLPMHLALISWRLRRKLEWDAEKEQFVNDNEANALLSRKRRKKWDLI